MTVVSFIWVRRLLAGALLAVAGYVGYLVYWMVQYGDW